MPRASFELTVEGPAAARFFGIPSGPKKGVNLLGCSRRRRDARERVAFFAATRHEHMGIEYASSLLVRQRLDSLLLLRFISVL